MKKPICSYLVSLSLLCTLLMGCASSKPGHTSEDSISLVEAQSSKQTSDTSDQITLGVAEPDTFNTAELPMIVEDMPMLIGGLGTIQKRVTYPAHLSKKGINGRVFIQFVVDVKGNVTQLKVMKSLHPDLDRIALDAVAQARFKPGKQKGVPVPVKMSLPITFRSR